MIVYILLLAISTEFKVNWITINGNRYFTEKDIKNVMLTRPPGLFRKGDFNSEIFKGDIAAIGNLYKYNGFLESTINHRIVYDSIIKRVNIEITILEGQQTFVESLTFDGNMLFTNEHLQDVLASVLYEPFDRRKLDLDAYMITTAYDDSGYADVTVQVDYNTVNGKAHIDYLIVENERQYVECVEFSGLERTHAGILYREMLLKQDDIFRYALVLNSQRNLHNLGIFTSIRTEIKDADTPNHKIIHFSLLERNAVNLYFRIGYGTRDYLRLGSGAKHVNLFGQAWQGKVEGKWSFAEYHVNSQLAFPRLFSFPVRFTVGSFYQFKKEIGFRTRGIGGYAATHLDMWTGTISTKYEIERIRTYFPDSDSIQDDWLQGLTFNWLKDHRNDPLYTKTGDYVNALFETSGIIFPSDVHYAKSTFNYRVFRPIMILTTAASFKIGMVQEIGPTQQLPVYKRFFCGGTSSVRGYTEWSIGPVDENNNPLGGKIHAEISSELRFPIYGILGGVIFIDGGNIWQEFKDLNMELRWGVGAGLRLRTPLGSVRLDYGLKLDKQADESVGVIHFAVGDAF
jgi:outer membrane protein insertion porin family